MSPFRTPRTSTHYGTVGFKEALIWALNCGSVIFRSPALRRTRVHFKLTINIQKYIHEHSASGVRGRRGLSVRENVSLQS